VSDHPEGAGNQSIQPGLLASIKEQLRKQLGCEPPPELLRRFALELLRAAPALAAAKDKLSRKEAHTYWRNAADDANGPEAYLNADPLRGELLLELIGRCRLESPSVLEIGCNAGRNLECLRQAGFTQLAGIEISQTAVDLLHRHFPQLAATANIHVNPVEDVIRDFADHSADLVFSMAVLVHIHTDSDWVLGEIARIARQNIITIEDERSNTERHFRRDYHKVFANLGFSQLHEQDCKGIGGLDAYYTARVFRREPGNRLL